MTAGLGSFGYAYPEFIYPETEFFEFKGGPVTNVAAGSWVVALFTVPGQNAVRLQNVLVGHTTSAAVGNRTLEIVMSDADGNSIVDFLSPLTVPAGTFVLHHFVAQLTNAYSISVHGYSPIVDLLLPPGYRVDLLSGGAQVGDVINTVNAVGVQVPTGSTQVRAEAPVPTPLFA